MNDDTVRHLWSDAELDEALAALHPHETTTDRAELDRARASLMRAAAAVSESDEPVVPQRKKRSGAWRWIAVAAAVAVLTGGVVVARELASAPSTLAPGGSVDNPEPGPDPTTRQRPIGMLFTHVTNNYNGIAWVNGTSAFIVRERVDFWIPADPSGTWIRRWTRSSPPELFTGKASDSSALPGPAQGEDYGQDGKFAKDFPHPGGSAAGDPPGWFHPTPEFLASLPTDPAKLTARLQKDLTVRLPPFAQNGPVPQPKYYGQVPQSPAYITYPSAAGMILSALTSGQVPPELRVAFVKVLDNPALGFHLNAIDPAATEYSTSDGTFETIVTMGRKELQVTGIRVVARGPAAGFPPGTTIGSAQYTYETTDQTGK